MQRNLMGIERKDLLTMNKMIRVIINLDFNTGLEGNWDFRTWSCALGVTKIK